MRKSLYKSIVIFDCAKKFVDARDSVLKVSATVLRTSRYRNACLDGVGHLPREGVLRGFLMKEACRDDKDVF